jgi:hypothetical protein
MIMKLNNAEIYPKTKPVVSLSKDSIVKRTGWYDAIAAAINEKIVTAP